MKYILQIIILLVSGFGFSTLAQNTAVMKATVQVVSGAGYTSIEEPLVDFNSMENNLRGGTFSLVSAPGTDLNIQISGSSSLVNSEGGAIDFESISVDKYSNESGEHSVSLMGKLAKAQYLRGHYQGKITATVEYL